MIRHSPQDKDDLYVNPMPKLSLKASKYLEKKLFAS
jgi:hypothetical protein